MKVNIVKEQIDELVKFLEPLLHLANFHMVDYFTNNDPLQTFFFNEISEIKHVGSENIINKIFKNDINDIPNLKDYITSCRKFDLKNCSNVCINLENFHDRLSKLEKEQLPTLKMNVFMNSKKSHEVEILSSICARIHIVSKTSHLVDIGDGKGYLSSFLSLHHKIPVLGVDSSKINTDGAIKRVLKLTKVWKSIAHKESEEKPQDTSCGLYKQITVFVDDEVDIKQIVSNVFLTKPTGIGLVGLHTCGNLSGSSLKLFVANDDIRTICNVGCCYHFINERFEDGHSFNPHCFPLSHYLQEKRFVIGRAARMIACQSIERILNKRELPNKTLFYRSLYEVLLKRKFPHLKNSEKQVGRFRKELSTFLEYVTKASLRLNVDMGNSDKEVEQLFMEYEDRRHDLNLFYLLRGFLASSIESLIMLDRLLFLLESGYENSFLVHLFDPVISPRCFGIIAIK